MKNMRMNSLLLKLGSLAASLSLVVVAANVSTACIGFLHQPKLPEGAKDLRKF